VRPWPATWAFRRTAVAARPVTPASRGVAGAHSGKQIFGEGALQIVPRGVPPVGAGGRVVHVGRPGVHDALPLRLDAVAQGGARELLQDPRPQFLGRGIERADVVRGPRQAGARRGREAQQRVHGIGHGHERDARVGPYEAVVGLAARGGVNHLGREVARAPRGQRIRRNQPGKPDAPEIDAADRRFRRELLVVAGVVVAEVLAVQLVAAVHRGGLREVVLVHPPDACACLEVGQAVRGDAGRVDKHHRPAVRLAFALGELEQRQRAFHVHLVGRHRRELRPRREQGGQVEDQVDLELGQDALEQRRIQDGPGELTRDERLDGGVEARQVERDDALASVPRQLRNQAVTNFSASARDEDDRCS
jgi:hypothetical protein